MSKRKWAISWEHVSAYVDRLRAARFTGRVQLTLEFNKGGISRAVALKQDSELYEERSSEGEQ